MCTGTVYTRRTLGLFTKRGKVGVGTLLEWERGSALETINLSCRNAIDRAIPGEKDGRMKSRDANGAPDSRANCSRSSSSAFAHWRANCSQLARSLASF